SLLVALPIYLNDLLLDVKSPQAFIKQRPLGYISPAQWQVGVPVAFIRYDASNYRYKYADINSQQSYLGINAGLNFAGWALRHQGSRSEERRVGKEWRVRSSETR